MTVHTVITVKPFLLDYVGFIKKIMKLMQIQYPMLAKVEVEMTQEKEMDELPNRPSKFGSPTLPTIKS